MANEDINTLKRKIDVLEQEIASFPAIAQEFIDTQEEHMEEINRLQTELREEKKNIQTEIDYMVQRATTTCCGTSIRRNIMHGIPLYSCCDVHMVCAPCIKDRIQDAIDNNSDTINISMCNNNSDKFREIGGDLYETFLEKKKEREFRQSLMGNGRSSFVKRPCCNDPMPHGFDNCMAVQCDKCPPERNFFCGLCFNFIGRYQEVHNHVRQCSKNVQKSRSYYSDTKHQKDVCELEWMRYHIKHTIGESAYAESGLATAEFKVVKNTLALVGLPTCRYGPRNDEN